MATEGGEYMSYAPSKRKVDEMELILNGDPTPDGLVSIECFDPHQSEPPYLTSPRSLEACKLSGVEPNELLILPLEYFCRTSEENMEVVQLRYHRFEQIRRRYVEKVKETRIELIKAEIKAKTEGTAHRSIEQIRKEFEEAIKAQEQAYLEKLQRRQQKELQQVMLYEIRVSAMQERKRREQLEAEEKEREEKRRRALAKRRADEMKMKADAAERAKQQEKMLAERREAAKMFEEYKAEAIAQERARAAAKKKNEAREQAQLKAHNDHVRATEEIFEWQRVQLEEKEKKIREADAERKKKLEERRWLRALRVARHKEQYKQKIAMVAKVKTELSELKKTETLKWLLAKDAVVQEYRQKVLHERMMEKAQRQSHRTDVTKRFNNQQTEGFDEAARRMAHKEQLFRQQRERLEAMLEMKRARNRLKEDEIRDFIEKKDRAEDYRKAKAYEALAFQDERFKMREDVRVMLANQRISATRTSFQKKEEILHQFERLMTNGKMTEEELIKAVEGFLGAPMPASMLQGDQEQKQGEGGDGKDDDSTMGDDEDASHAEGSSEGMAEGKASSPATDASKAHKDGPPGDAASSSAHLKTHVARYAGPSGASIGSAGTLSVDTGKNDSNIIVLKPAASPKGVASPSNNSLGRAKARAAPGPARKHAGVSGKGKGKYVPKIPPQLAYEILENLRKEQNEQLKNLLIQEQLAENQREALLLQTTDPAEQLRLETVVFAQERAEASDRIIRMTEEHEHALDRRKAELEAITLPPVSGAR